MSAEGTFRFPQLPNVGDRFQSFVLQVLSESEPDLISFVGVGKDGAIDLSATTGDRRHVVECKHIGEDGLTAARARWAVTRDHLRDHLDKFCKGQLKEKQYLPWTRTNPRIERYTFCVSSSLGNQESRDALANEIRGFFAGFAQPELAHLHAIQVRVMDASDWAAACSRDRLLKLRWFPQSPAFQGFLPLVSREVHKRFHQYLTEDRLSYFSRNGFAATAKVDWTEPAQLDYLEQPGSVGLVLHAPGGAGKSRLGLELGLLAEQRGWLVLRVRERARPDNLTAIGEAIANRRTVFLFDYIESHPNFVTLAQTIQSWNEELGLPVHFIANCRSSYYSALVAQRLSHRPVDLAQRGGEDYRAALVRHILRTRDLESEQAIRICSGVPIRAVFFAFLKDTGRTADLQELLRVESFEDWITTRASVTLAHLPPQERIPKAAEIMALLPLPHAVLQKLLTTTAWGPSVRAMMNDGWLEEVPGDEYDTASYAAPHDVFADTLLLSAVAWQPATTEHYLLGILRQAHEFGCAVSAFTAVQRVGGAIGNEKVSWGRLFHDLLLACPDVGESIRLPLFTAPFVPARDLLPLLRDHAALTEGLEDVVEFQNALGHAVQWVAEQPDAIGDGYKETLLPLVRRTLPRIHRINFLITNVLHWQPEEAVVAALDWCNHRLLFLQTHYVLVAWLDAGLPSEQIKSFVFRWLRGANERNQSGFASVLQASFVYQSWLDAVTGGGKAALAEQDRDVILDPLRQWLAAATSTDAAGRPIPNCQTPQAQFVYKSWLDAVTGGGRAPLAEQDRDVVLDPLRQWLMRYGTLPQAVYLWKDALRQRPLSSELVCQALNWCRHNPQSPDSDSLWRLAQCRELVGPPDVNAAYRAATEVVLPTVAKRSVELKLTRVIHGALVVYLRLTDESSPEWRNVLTTVLNNTRIFNRFVFAQPAAQDPLLPNRVATLLLSGEIFPNSKAIGNFAAWIHAQWAPEQKVHLEPTVRLLCAQFPDQETTWLQMLTSPPPPLAADAAHA